MEQQGESEQMWEGGWWQGWREEEVGPVSVPAVREKGSRLRGARKYGSLPQALRRAGAASSLVPLLPPFLPSLPSPPCLPPLPSSPPPPWPPSLASHPSFPPSPPSLPSLFPLPPLPLFPSSLLSLPRSLPTPSLPFSEAVEHNGRGMREGTGSSLYRLPAGTGLTVTVQSLPHSRSPVPALAATGWSLRVLQQAQLPQQPQLAHGCLQSLRCLHSLLLLLRSSGCRQPLAYTIAY